MLAQRAIEERGNLDTVATGRAERDVSWDLRGAFPPVKRKHYAAVTDLKEVGPLLRLVDGYVGTLSVRCALRLAPLLLVRPGELRKAEMADIDLDVFPNARYPHRDRTMSDSTLWGAFRALDIPPERMTPHGFRAMARTILDEVLGLRPDFIEHQLAHAVRDRNGRAYNRTAFLPERKLMMQAWADYLDRLRSGDLP